MYAYLRYWFYWVGGASPIKAMAGIPFNDVLQSITWWHVVELLKNLLETGNFVMVMWAWGPPRSCHPWWAPCWPHEPCYQGCAVCRFVAVTCHGDFVNDGHAAAPLSNESSPQYSRFSLCCGLLWFGNSRFYHQDDYTDADAIARLSVKQVGKISVKFICNHTYNTSTKTLL